MHEPTITFTGNLAAKPALRLVDGPQGRVAVANLRVAVTPRRRARDAEEWTDGETMWFSVSTWRTTAANCAASLNQGDRVVVRGRLTQRTWRDAEGVDRPSFDVEAEHVGLDISRHAAMVVGRTPEQRAEPVAVDDGEPSAEPEEEPVAV